MTEPTDPRKVVAALRVMPREPTLVERAIDAGWDHARLLEVIELSERHRANEARTAFGRAMAAAMAEMPVIPRRGHNPQTGKNYPLLGDALELVQPVLGRHGLHVWFEVDSGEAEMTVTCVVSHEDGHERRTRMSSPILPSPVGRESGKGSMNVLQQRGATQTYLQRYTLMAALGLATGDEDEDGRSAAPAEDVTDTSRIEAGIKAATTPEALQPWKAEVQAIPNADQRKALVAAYNSRFKELHTANATATTSGEAGVASAEKAVPDTGEGETRNVEPRRGHSEDRS